MDRSGETFKHLDSFVIGVALGVLTLGMPEVIADLVRVADLGSFTALLRNVWDAFVSSIVPMSIGGAAGFWLLRRDIQEHRRTFWRSILSGFSTATLLVAFGRLPALHQVGISEAVRLSILAVAGTLGVLLGHSRLTRQPKAHNAGTCDA